MHRPLLIIFVVTLAFTYLSLSDDRELSLSQDYDVNRVKRSADPRRSKNKKKTVKRRKFQRQRKGKSKSKKSKKGSTEKNQNSGQNNDKKGSKRKMKSQLRTVSASCLVQMSLSMRRWKDVVSNFQRQSKRITDNMKKGAGKSAKSNVFAPVAEKLISAGGGNMSALECGGNTDSEVAKNLTQLGKVEKKVIEFLSEY